MLEFCPLITTRCHLVRDMETKMPTSWNTWCKPPPSNRRESHYILKRTLQKSSTLWPTPFLPTTPFQLKSLTPHRPTSGPLLCIILILTLFTLLRIKLLPLIARLSLSPPSKLWEDCTWSDNIVPLDFSIIQLLQPAKRVMLVATLAMDLLILNAFSVKEVGVHLHHPLQEFVHVPTILRFWKEMVLVLQNLQPLKITIPTTTLLSLRPTLTWLLLLLKSPNR